MNHEVRMVVVMQRLPPQPFEEVVPVRGVENVLNGVFRPQTDDLLRYGEQEQVVIAEDHLGGGAELFEIAKDAEGAWATIDQISDAPEAVYGGIKPDLCK